jgi:predicted TPR repeat methyltransferase
LEEYLRAVKHHETLGPEIWSRIGDLRASHGELDAAVGAWERALVLDPSHGNARARLDAARKEA